MPDHITHNLEEEADITFAHSPDPAYLALIDADSYPFFASPDLDYDGMLTHLGEQMAMHTCVVWGCPEATLNCRVLFTRDHRALDSITQYAAGFQRWIRTSGRLCFSSHADLYHCATNPGWSVFDFPGTKSPDEYLSRELVVPQGIYSVSVFRHFGWFEGNQDAPMLCDGMHYTVILRHYQDESVLGIGKHQTRDFVPWS